MQFHVGTSGYSYKEWKGSFYPAKLPAKEMLKFYAERFSTVEINASFYRMPKEDVVKGWAEETPAGFRFVLKAPQRITHHRRLKEVDDDVDHFLKVAAALGDRQGPLLFQLPPNMKKDVARLESFLAFVGDRAAVAFEFRHESWLDDEVLACLRQHKSVLCVADAEDLPSPDLAHTADWGYVRLRQEEYTDEELSAWIARMKKQKWQHVYVFFRHEDTGTGPKFAVRFLELAGK